MALDPYRGTILRQGASASLRIGDLVYSIQSSDPDIQSVITKLKSGDELSGLASLNDQTLTFETVDYIGLKQLLGSWRDNSLFMIVPNFTELNFVNMLIQKTPALQLASIASSSKPAASSVAAPTPQLAQKYIYSVHPASDDGFALFLSDAQTTWLAEIQITGKNLKLIIYDSQSGDVLHNLSLTKL